MITVKERKKAREKKKALKYAIWLKGFMYRNCKGHCPLMPGCEGCPHHFNVLDSVINNISQDGINEPRQ